MNEAAIIQGQLVDIRNAGQHKDVVLKITIPAELAMQVMDCFGWPTQVNPVPVAIARLIHGAAATPKEAVSDRCDSDSPPPAPARAHKAFRKLSYAQQAGILCADPKFWRFLSEECPNDDGLVKTEEDAVYVVRNICLVDSRRDIIPGSVAARAWRELVDRYRVWELVPV